jgi:hypothetical protein
VFRLEFSPVGCVSEDTYQSYADENLKAGYPLIEKRTPHDVPLAVVGGGPSAGLALDELIAWPGDIWAINQGATWLASHGRTEGVTLFSVDPLEDLVDWVGGVERALLGTSCHPKLFEALKGKDVAMFHTRPIRGYVPFTPADLERSESNPQGPKTEMFGPSSVTRIFYPAAVYGYKDVTFFGCEGSIGERTHAYRHEERSRQIIVKAGDVDYYTTPDYYMTTQFLANVMREYPKLKEKSGGLLRAMINNWDTWYVAALSEELRNTICPDLVEAYAA